MIFASRMKNNSSARLIFLLFSTLTAVTSSMSVASVSSDIHLRPLLKGAADQEIVWKVLQHAAHEPNDIRDSPILRPYGEEFGTKLGDFGVVAVNGNGDTVGAAWVRKLFDSGGFAQVASEVPELAIAVLPNHQGQGIGTKLINSILEKAEHMKVPAVCLCCRTDNAALRLYERLGFQQVYGSEQTNRAGGTSVTMVYSLITIREASAQDASIVLDLIKKKSEFDRSVGAFCGELGVTTESLLETILSADSPYAYVLLAEQGDKVFGFALYYFRYSSFAGRPSLWLDDLFVCDSVRSQGAGAKLMKELAAVASQNGCTHLGWTADARNTRGLKFYNRLGATISEQHGSRCVFHWKPAEWRSLSAK